VKSPLYPLLVLAALTAAQSAHAQQGGVTILRGQSGDQPATGTPDTGVRRVPNGAGGGSSFADKRDIEYARRVVQVGIRILF